MPTTQQGSAGLPYDKASGNTSPNTMRVVIADDSPGTGGSGTPFDANITKVAGSPVDVGIGNAGAGTIRVALATDTPISLTAAQILLDTADIEAQQIDGSQKTQIVDSSNVNLATAGNPLRVDPTGTTTQPVSAASLPLPTGASTSALQTEISGKLGLQPTTLLHSTISINSSGDNVVISGVALQTIQIYGVHLQIQGGDMDILLESNATPISATYQFLSGDLWILDKGQFPHFSTAVGEDFVINLSAANTLVGEIYYTQS